MSEPAPWRNVALVTGASSGLGEALAHIHAQHGGDLVLVARRLPRLEALKPVLEKRYGVRVLALAADLSRRQSVEDICRSLRAHGIEPAILINNAGFSGHGRFHERPWEADAAMIQVNIVALSALTRALLPSMVARGHGRVLNMASLAGFLPGPLQAVYYASKAYVLSFSEALATELEGSGVTVTALCPGPVATEFQAVAGLGSKSGVGVAAAASDVAQVGYAAMLRGRAVRVVGWKERALTWVLRLLPRLWVRRLSHRSMIKRGLDHRPPSAALEQRSGD